MAGRETPYDPYVPAGHSSGGGSGSHPARSTNLDAAQAELQDTIGIMAKNQERMAQRGAKLDDLTDKTNTLAQSAQGFRQGANRVRKQMWWKDMKMRICIIVGIIILLLIIILPIAITKSK